MTKFTAKENATRKEVFNYNRNRKSWSDSCTKKFGKSKVVLAAIEESDKRIAASVNLTEKQLFINNVKTRIQGLASCLPSSGYSMGEDKYITCRVLGGYVDHFDACQEYARSCKYRAKHGRVEVALPVRILAKAENMHGMITVRTKQIQNRIWKAQWVVFDYTRDGRGFITSDIKWHLESGYVVRYEQGRSRHIGYEWELAGSNYEGGWYHTTNLADARQRLGFYLRDEKFFAKWQKWDTKRKADDAKKREQEAKAEARAKAKADKELARQMKAVQKSSELKDALAHMYVYQDSIKAGNCVPGTNNFLAAHNLQKTDTRSGEFLLRISRKTWQHANVVRILMKHVAETSPAFYEQNNQALRSILNTL